MTGSKLVLFDPVFVAFQVFEYSFGGFRVAPEIRVEGLLFFFFNLN